MTERAKIADLLLKSNWPDRHLDEQVARALGYRIAATTRGPHIMRDGSSASWDLPAYSATLETRVEAAKKLLEG